MATSVYEIVEIELQDGTKVIEIYPTISPKLARKKDSNKADAILIGKYFIDNYKNDSFHG